MLFTAKVTIPVVVWGACQALSWPCPCLWHGFPWRSFTTLEAFWFFWLLKQSPLVYEGSVLFILKPGCPVGLKSCLPLPMGGAPEVTGYFPRAGQPGRGMNMASDSPLLCRAEATGSFLRILDSESCEASSPWLIPGRGCLQRLKTCSLTPSLMPLWYQLALEIHF